MSSWLPIVVAVAWATILGLGGGLLTELGPWYRDLRKPGWQPPDWAFGPVWTIVLASAALAAIIGWHGARTDGQRMAILIVYGVNFVCHGAWSPLFFKAKRPDWSLVESVFLWASVVAMTVVLAAIDPGAAWLLSPYVVWVSIAAILNRAIVVLNGPFDGAPGRAR